MDRKLTTGQAAELLGYSPATIRRMIDEGRIPHERLPGGNVDRRVLLSDLRTFAQTHNLTLVDPEVPAAEVGS